MERGVHGTAWIAGQHNYHPSLPTRRLRMIEEWAELRATVVAWGALGGGGISLAHLEEEAYGKVDARSRIYGYVNDRDFVAACRERDITVFGVVFVAQGWEFPVELTDAEDEILALNELRGVGRRSTIGLREFSQNRYPDLWPPIEHWFPDGLRNSVGEPVTDLIEEACIRGIDGRPLRARWLECPDREHRCFLMHPVNPVWREYLKAIVRIQIDAGVDGVQFDEPDASIIGIGYGGCFCRDCVAGFREYLQAVPGDGLPTELRGVDLAGFDYGEWLRSQGRAIHPDLERTPLFWEYLRFHRQTMVANLRELADYARSYASEQGRTVRIGMNLLHFDDRFHALQPSVDLPLSEQKATYRQPAWYRYASGLAGGGPVVAVMNPLGDGDVLDLVPALQEGHALDRYRIALCEAAAFGVNLSVPYGAWMGPVVEDAFYGPRAESIEIQSFLADNESLFGADSLAETAFVYSVESTRRTIEHDVPLAVRAEVFGGWGITDDDDATLPFWRMADAFAAAHQPLDVIVLPDPELRADTITTDHLLRYRTVVLPDARYLTAAQVDAIEGYAEQGGQVLIRPPLAENDEGAAERLRQIPTVRAVPPEHPGFDPSWLADGPQVVVHADIDLAVHVHHVDEAAVVHVVRYDYDDQRDAVPTRASLRLDVRLPHTYTTATAHSIDGALGVTLVPNGRWHQIELQVMAVYGAVRLS